MRKILLFLFILNLFQIKCFSQKTLDDNIILISYNYNPANEIVDISEFIGKYNKFNINSFNSAWNSNLEDDTLSSKIKDLRKQQKFNISKNEYFEIWWKVHIDSTLENKVIGFQFKNADFTSVFWDGISIVNQGKIDVTKNVFEPNNIFSDCYPIFTGKSGFHYLIVRQKFKKDILDNNSLCFLNFNIYKNYNKYIEELEFNQNDFITICIEKGLGFFLFCVWIISILFYFIVEKRRSFLWFSGFLLCTLIIILQRYLNNNVASFYYIIIQNTLICCLLFSFLAFVFYAFFDKMPKRIYWYLFPFTILNILPNLPRIIAIHNEFPILKKIESLAGITLLVIFIFEILLVIIKGIKAKKKRLKIIAFGILQFLILLIFSGFLPVYLAKIVATFSIYLLPISFLITLIYIVKDSFIDNLTKEKEVLTLTQSNAKILAEQNETLELQVKHRTEEVVAEKLVVEKQKQIVEEKNREILDSIEYALRIQTAILPPQKIVKQYLENSFILYKPKDIVAGDFYWMENINDLVLFAACDCTGHGVPGAMVSVVCHNALNRAVREFGLTQPAAILDKTAEIVIENFSKSEEDIKDGMDISLCAYNSKTRTIQWAGANNPLWLMQNGELIETKADKQPIGMNEDSKPFTNHTFVLNDGDTIYLFTDGFADQFGGETGEKKLTKRRFKDLLIAVQSKSIQDQGITLDKFITEYRKEIEQIDDILVMGVKV